MAIDYQVGDIVEVYFYFGSFEKFALVVDIDEKGGDFKLIPSGQRFRVLNKELHLLKKSKTGTLLYGNKKEQYSKG